MKRGGGAQVGPAAAREAGHGKEGSAAENDSNTHHHSQRESGLLTRLCARVPKRVTRRRQEHERCGSPVERRHEVHVSPRTAGVSPSRSIPAMGKDGFFAVGAVVAAALVWLTTFSSPELSLPDLPALWPGRTDTSAPEAIVVLIVGSRANVARVRAAVDDDRVIVDGPNAFALEDGRVIAASAEVASEPLNAAGWVDRTLELIMPPKRRADVLSAPGAASSGSGSSGAPLLSQGEAQRLLEQLR